MAVNERVVVFGEALIDMFSVVDEKLSAATKPFRFEGVVGGAPANVAVHLVHLGQPTALLTAFADDGPAEGLQKALSALGVDLGPSVVVADSRTPLAFVSAKPDGEREFRLYLQGSALESLTASRLAPAVFDGAGWFHFGSVLLSLAAPHDATRHLLRWRRRRDIVTSYDINVRPDVWRSSAVDKRTLLDVLHEVDVLKLSDEDFKWLAEQVDGGLREPADLLRRGCCLIAHTEGAKGASLLTASGAIFLPAPSVRAVDTTGAGDAFMAGLIAGLRTHGIKSRRDLKRPIDERTLRAAGEIAVQRAASVLSRRGAMPV